MHTTTTLLRPSDRCQQSHCTLLFALLAVLMKPSAIRLCLIVATISSPPCVDAFLNFSAGIEGTENLGMTNGLTDKQLAIQRQIAEWTLFMVDDDGAFKWDDYFVGESGGFLAGPRFSLGFISYALNMLQYRTPQYTEVNARILKHIALRFREKETWNRSPDPIDPQRGNVMYSGHVAQQLAIYESISGDLELGKTPWTYGTDTEYTLEKIQQEHYRWQEHYGSGGISCGGSIFMVCNGHAHSANALYDAVHSTNFTGLRSKWTDFLSSYEHPATTDGTGALVSRGNQESWKLTWRSILTNSESWATGDIACGMEDAWTGTEFFRWAETNDLGLIREAWERLAQNPGWVDDDNAGTSYFKMTGALDMLDLLGCGPLNKGCADELMHSFYVLMEEQNKRRDGTETTPLRKDRVLRWQEDAWGTPRDMDNDGYKESFAYWTSGSLKLPLYGAPIFAGDMWITANLVQAMVYDPEFALRSYHEPFFKSKFASYPKLSDVDFPTIAVAKAVYDVDDKALKFALVINAPTDIGVDQVTVDCMGRTINLVTLNGEALTDWKQGADGVADIRLRWVDRAEVVVQF